MRRASPVLALAILLATTAAEAHSVGLSYGRYTHRAGDRSVLAQLTFARNEVLELLPNAPRELDERALGAGRAAIDEALVRTLRVRGDGQACPGELEDLHLTEEDGVIVQARFACPSEPKLIAVELGFIDRMAPGHRHVIQATFGGSPIERVAYRGQARFQAEVGAQAESAAEAPSNLGSFFGLGVEHILTGWDHLAFLFGLLLVAQGLRALLAVITAFTLAHSLTLGLAVLGVWAPGADFVEPAIAASVAYVGIENLWLKRRGRAPAHRWRLTFLFGLIHGFGFAGALGQIALPRHEIPVALLLFNLGVETGQLGVVALVLPLIAAARKWLPRFETLGVSVLSAMVAIAGLIWFVARIKYL